MRGQTAVAIKYTDCNSAKSWESSNKQSDSKDPVLELEGKWSTISLLPGPL